ncbi:methylisocitrate lyase [Oceanisphaera arctica]|uniref:2-methylisocitrate lyase n=1 Tax=Oceanisphaera arctica TaxID=641510 RepID=A0A2P5TRX8_9GAMM|nr:methylisocitrate lyase [Oceanisphaera arctica]PPL18579.1 methylisocitrate lyase [Oceanisphaera arctica]GHA17542.1 2-methylisocitrate lyase [Oceanisphaera arctica]
MKLSLFEVLQGARPLAIVGAVNAYSAMQAEQAGHQALYLSGAGVANASFGLPDLGITSLNDVLEDARRITAACELPLLVDADTGFGGAFNIARTVREMERAGVAGLHIEDQVAQKRCGHRPNKAIVSLDEMVDRVTAAVDARTDARFAIMARTDALAVEGMNSAVERAQACVAAGADFIFPEAMESLEQYRSFCEAVKVPVLANITEFGKTPLFSQNELADAGVAMVLYPLSAFRAMSLAAETVYRQILSQGHQRDLLTQMQTREQLYQTLGYHDYEAKLDALFEHSVQTKPSVETKGSVGNKQGGKHD